MKLIDDDTETDNDVKLLMELEPGATWSHIIITFSLDFLWSTNEKSNLLLWFCTESSINLIVLLLQSMPLWHRTYVVRLFSRTFLCVQPRVPPVRTYLGNPREAFCGYSYSFSVNSNRKTFKIFQKFGISYINSNKTILTTHVIN